MQTLTTEPATERPIATVSTPGFGATLRSEWTKFATLRSNWISIVLALFLSVGFTALLSWTIGISWKDWGDSDRAAFDPVVYSTSGLLFAGIIFVVLAVNLVAAEYSSGMIRQTFSTTPRRGRVMLAKMLVITAVTLVVGLLVNIGILWAAQLVFRAYDVPSASLIDNDTIRAIALLTLVGPVFPIIAVAVAFMLRSAATAITLMLAILFLPSIFGGLLPQRWQEDVLAWLPGSLTDSISIGFLSADNVMMKDEWVATAALVSWLAVIVGSALWLLNRKDA